MDTLNKAIIRSRRRPVHCALIAVHVAFSVISCAWSESTASASAPSHFAHGEINPLLHAQGLSHFAFHNAPVQTALAALFAPRTVTIVGVEWGNDVVRFANAGYHVIAVEPVAKFIAHLNDLIKRHPHWNLTVLPFAATNQSDASLHLRYDNEDVVETVPTTRLDDHIDERMAVLSADVQGDELAVLQGSARLLRDSVDSLWIEGIACNERVLHILDLLDNDFVLFDFVPWGKPLAHSSDDVPEIRASFAMQPRRPSSFHDYFHWMCDEATVSYQWLQTDFLAVRRSFAHDVWSRLSTLAQDKCVESHSNCLLRQLLSDSPSSAEQKDEL